MIATFFLILDPAKLESTPEDMTVYAALEASADLTVNFRINPFSNYTVSWSMGNLEVNNTDISNTEKEEYVQTTYSISNVTKPQLGSYSVLIVNRAIIGHPNEATFTVVLALKGENNILCTLMLLQHILASFILVHDIEKTFINKNGM